MVCQPAMPRQIMALMPARIKTQTAHPVKAICRSQMSSAHLGLNRSTTKLANSGTPNITPAVTNKPTNNGSPVTAATSGPNTAVSVPK
jgi:hypothetical protein